MHSVSGGLRFGLHLFCFGGYFCRSFAAAADASSITVTFFLFLWHTMNYIFCYSLPKCPTLFISLHVTANQTNWTVLLFIYYID